MSVSRHEQVINLRKAGLTYAAIGRRLTLTRERARQIAKGVTKAKKNPARDPLDGVLTTAQVAEFLNVHVNTVRRWSDRGILVTYRIGPRGDRRFRQRDIDNFIVRT